ncbi:MAG: hypothetical protein AB8H03_14390 [Saprospiraceae bacterium]
MKKHILIFILSFFFIFSLSAQTSMKENLALVEKTSNQTVAKIKLNDLDYFKNQFARWNVGNLHIYSQAKNSTNQDYYFKGEKVDPIFQQYLPKNLKKKVIEEGKEPHHVALVRAQKLKNNYILRINDGKNNNTLVMYGLKKDQLRAKKTLAYFYRKGNRTFQMDSWIQDLNGDTRLDLIQKKQIKVVNGNILKEQTKVFLQKKNGKFKHSRKTKIETSDYKMQPIN